MKMRDLIRIVEALRPPSTDDIPWKKDDLGWTTEFQTPSGRWFNIRVSRLSLETGWAFEFSEIPLHVLWVTGRANKPDQDAIALSANPIGSLAPTGRGEAFFVYSTVVAAMEEFLRDERPERVRFKGATGRQTRLYRAIMKNRASDIAALGYKSNGAALVATRKK